LAQKLGTTLARITADPSAQHSLEIFLKEAGKYKPLTQQQEAVLVAEKLSGSRKAQTALINHNLLFVVSRAKYYIQFVQSTCFLGDLIQAGNIGLIEAVETYNPNKFEEGRINKLISHAKWWVNKRIMGYMNDNTRVIRVPAQKVANLLSLRKAAEANYHIHGVYDLYLTAEDENDKALLAGLPPLYNLEHIRYLEAADFKPMSLTAPLTEDGDGTLQDSLASESVADLEAIDRLESDMLENIYKELPANEARMLKALLKETGQYQATRLKSRLEEMLGREVPILVG
jgi:DNA-directed RNA polymerase sigma subunit (sigma70/sigma32)